jgi:head-tail adaptor
LNLSILEIFLKYLLMALFLVSFVSCGNDDAVQTAIENYKDSTTIISPPDTPTDQLVVEDDPVDNQEPNPVDSTDPNDQVDDSGLSSDDDSSSDDGDMLPGDDSSSDDGDVSDGDDSISDDDQGSADDPSGDIGDTRYDEEGEWFDSNRRGYLGSRVRFSTDENARFSYKFKIRKNFKKYCISLFRIKDAKAEKNLKVTIESEDGAVDYLYTDDSQMNKNRFINLGEYTAQSTTRIKITVEKDVTSDKRLYSNALKIRPGQCR